MEYTSLIIEPSLPVRNDLKRVIDDIGLFNQVLFSSNARETRNILKQQRIDMVLCSWCQDTAPFLIETCKVLPLNDDWADIPVVAFCHQQDVNLKIFALENGITDCHDLSTSPRELEARMRMQIRKKERTRLLREEKKHLALLARTDNLTKLYNRAHFDEMMASELARCRRTGQPLSLLMLDLDYFKNINDSFGHPCGDAILQSVARVLQQTTRISDVVCRYGGEEFAIILPDTSVANAYVTAEKVRRAIESLQLVCQQETLSLTVSIGINGTRGLGPVQAYELVKGADNALYSSKQKGRNRTEIFRPAAPVRPIQEYPNYPQAAIGFA